MAQEQSEFLFNIQAGTSGIEDAVRKLELLKKSIADVDAMSKKTVLGPTGTPANVYLAERTPSIQRTAEQNILLQSQAAERAMSRLYVPPDYGGPKVRYDIPKQQQQLLEYQNAQQLLLTHQTQGVTVGSSYTPMPFQTAGNLGAGIKMNLPTEYDASQLQRYNTIYSIFLANLKQGTMSQAEMNRQLENFDAIITRENALKKQVQQPTTSKATTQVFEPPAYDVEQLKSASDAYKNLNVQLKAGLLTHSQYNQSLKSLNQTFGTHYKSIENTGLAMAKLAVRAALVIPIWMALRSAYMFLINAVGQGINFWKEFESTLAEVRIVGKGTEEDFKTLGNSVLMFSTVYGVSASKALEAAKTFAQQGLTVKETIEMTRVAMIGAQVLGEDVATVADDLTAAIRAYNIPMQESLTIVDKWMKVQKEFAVTAKDLASAMKTAGATAAAFGISIDQFQGHVTAIIETTRKSGSEAANALQMIYTRLLTTARPAIQTIANVPVFQDTTGKAVMDTTNIFRNANDVLDDLAATWGKLTEAEKIELATQVGSRRQATPFIALMENYNRGLLAQVASLSAAGTALESYRIKQDTVAVKMVQMQNQWLATSQAIQQTGPWKGALDIIRDMGEGLLVLINRTKAYENQILKQAEDELAIVDIEESRAKAVDELIKMEERLMKTGRNPEVLAAVRKNLEELLKNPIKSLDEVAADRLKVNIERQTADLEAQLRLISEKKDSASLLDRHNGYYDNLLEQEKTIQDKIKERKALIESTDLIAKNKDVGKPLDDEAIQAQIELNQKQAIQLIQHRVNLLKAAGATEEQILQYQILQYETSSGKIDIETKNLELTRLRNQLEEEIANRLKEQKDIMRDMFKTGFNNIFETGGGLGKALNEGLIKSFRDTFSTGLADMINATGIGDIFANSVITLQNAFTIGKDKIADSHILGITKGADIIINAHRVGMSNGAAELQSELTTGITNGKVNPALQAVYNTMAETGTAGWSGSNRLPTNTMQSGLAASNYGIGGAAYTDQAGNFGTLPWGFQGNVGKQQSTRPKNQWTGQAVMGMGQAALTGYSAYQSARAGGVGVGGSVASGVLGAGASVAGLMSGIAAGAGAGAQVSLLGLTMGPVGWAIAAVGLMVMSLIPQLFAKRQKQESSQTSTTENRVASKIDISNKNLEIINRNLLGLKSAIETYMLPSSAYFAEKRGLEDNFSLHMRRGLN